jgi:hypothetical protein
MVGSCHTYSPELNHLLFYRVKSTFVSLFFYKAVLIEPWKQVRTIGIYKEEWPINKYSPVDYKANIDIDLVDNRKRRDLSLNVIDIDMNFKYTM